MHIADGVLPVWVSAGGWTVTVPGLAISLRRLPPEEVPRLALLTAAIFMASLIHLPFGPTSVHLILNGLAGVLLGPLSFLAFFVALTLQALLFQFGGLLSLGVNTLIMGGPAFLVGWFSRRNPGALRPSIAGLLAATAVLLSGILLALFLSFSGEAFFGVARLALLAHLPVALLEGFVTALMVAALKRLRPGILALALGAALLWSPQALAHRLELDVFPEKDGLRVEAFFPDGTPARNDRVFLYCGEERVATAVTDEEGVAHLPRPDCPEVRVLVVGKLGHRAERTVKLEPAPSRPSAERVSSGAVSHRQPLPLTGLLSGLGFIFGLSAFILAWDTRRRLKSLASSGN